MEKPKIDIDAQPTPSDFDAPCDEEWELISQEISQLKKSTSPDLPFGFGGQLILGLIPWVLLILVDTLFSESNRSLADNFVNLFENFFLDGIGSTVVFLIITLFAGVGLNLIASIPAEIWASQTKKKNTERLGELDRVAQRRTDYERASARWTWLSSVTNQGYWLKQRGVGLEVAVKELLESQGLTVSLTPTSGDEGIDLIAYEEETSYLLQCKGLSKVCGVGAIRDAAGVKAIHKKPMLVICPHGFTAGAQETAQEADVGLLSVFELIALAKEKATLNMFAQGPRKIVKYEDIK